MLARSKVVFAASRLTFTLSKHDMKRLLGIVGLLFFAVAVLSVILLAYSTAKGYTRWYFRVDGLVTIDGRQSSGYLHANTQKTILLLTRTDEKRPETYLIPLGEEKTVLDCGDWHPVRLLPFPVGHFNPPCSVLSVSPADILDGPVSATLVRAGRSIQFTTASGRKVKAKF